MIPPPKLSIKPYFTCLYAFSYSKPKLLIPMVPSSLGVTLIVSKPPSLSIVKVTSDAGFALIFSDKLAQLSVVTPLTDKILSPFNKPAFSAG